MLKNVELFDMVEIVTSEYEADFLKAQRTRDESVKELQENFMVNSPLYIQRRNEINSQYADAIQKAQEKHLKTFTDELEKVKCNEIAEAGCIGKTAEKAFTDLEHIAKIPLNDTEFGIIVSQYGNKEIGGYFIDRLLCKIAADNGISHVPVQADIATKLEILGTLEARVKRFVGEFDGTSKLSTRLAVSDKNIQKLEERYTNSYSGITMDAATQAKRMVNTALSKWNVMERATYMANAIRTSKPEVKEKILELLAKDDNAELNEITMKAVGVHGAVEQFREQDLADLEAAEKAMEAVRGAQSHQEILGIVFDNIESRRFHEAMQREIDGTKNEKLKEIFEDAKEIHEENKIKSDNA